MIANSSIKHSTNGKMESPLMAVGHEWDMHSKVHYLCYTEECPIPWDFVLSIFYRNKISARHYKTAI